ncbi:DUF1700 domain-containing protein [Staphylococcus devriesei]|uniref:DUF1700 domain-containing protein n=1 Tax=Staphylococcus devriesei TaxID=586733 RepID=A0A2K4DRP5_9STAP|nr:DUF1700 domain-containing protein [Staphylococcus devriesei]MCE5090985.1 DUF1700 domain-containing protein [Staphylococcus devriesei]MCE5097990.1 DUF1700 domain-containing protein [Staphylococcus devriesei]PNZ89478.1 hypothetical protein CD147_02770 [Staphylococcus devriesei]PTE69962.1 DUF1700 domain-containing protein [Staphylococcus devriesei]PTF04010.1 DUF1700 domain-containing protein [Staphylococcus devriesei]
MDKITFLNELELELDQLPRDEKDTLMNDYENYFYEQENRGKSEQEILSNLKEPHIIGKEAKAKKAISYAKVTPNLHNIIRAIMASLSLGAISFFFIIIPILMFLFVLFFAFLFSLSLLCLPLLLIITSIVRGIPNSLSNILFSISYAGIGIILLVLIIKTTQNIYRLVLKYLSWYIQRVKGRIRQ